MELQSKEGVCIVRCFEWNGFGASCTMQMVYQFGKKYYADFKGKVISFEKTESIIKLSCANSVICYDSDLFI